MEKKIDYNSLGYFFRFKNLERMSNWPEQLGLLRKIHPEVAKAYSEYWDAEYKFRRIFERMLDEAEY